MEHWDPRQFKSQNSSQMQFSMVGISRLISGDFWKMVKTYRILTILVPIESSRKAAQNNTKFIIIHPFYKIRYNIFNNNMKMSPLIFQESQEKSIHAIEIV